MSRTWHKKRAERHTGSRRFDPSCRPHGDCPWCASNRDHKSEKRSGESVRERLEESVRERLEEVKDE